MTSKPNLWHVQLLAQLAGLAVGRERLESRFAPGAGDLDTAGVIDALRELGFDTELRRGGFDKLRRDEMPVLGLGRNGSLVLVLKADADSVLVQQAGATRGQLVARREFARAWDGRWIAASRPERSGAAASHGAGRAAGAADTGPRRFGIGWFFESIAKYRGLLGEVLAASFFLQLFALVTPLIFQVVIDKVLTHRSLTTLDVLVIALVAVTLFEAVLGAVRHYVLAHTTNRVDVELGVRLFRHLMRLPLAWFESRRAGDTVARMRELENVRGFLTGQALTAAIDLAFTVVFLAVMWYYSPRLTIVVLLALPVLFAVSFAVAPLLRGRLEDRFALGAENQSFLVETVTSMETLKSQAVEGHWQRDWDNRLARYARAGFRSGELAAATNQAVGFLAKILTAILLWLGAKLVIDGELTVGGLIAFNMLAARVNAPILRIAQLWQDFQQMRVSVRRLADVLDSTPEPAFRPDRSTLPALAGRVEFEHVGFRYRADGPEILADVSFAAEPGEIVGIVGVSGAGKSTLLRLIQRLYSPERGRVLVDGVDLALVDTSWLRRQIGVVAQDAVLFNRSVRENIALATPDLPLEDVIIAAKLAGAHEFVLELPEGYDTPIGERGARLSGGQRARIAIARALVHDPRILLLDEATASLDYESERLIHDNMTRIAAGRTVFIASHRLPALRLANRILTLERGRLVENGPHRELVAANGRYAALFRLQEAAHAA